MNEWVDDGAEHVVSDSIKAAEASVRTSPAMLAEVAKIIDERGEVYGHPLPNHERIARFFNAVLADKLKEPVTATEVAMCMIGLKLARLVETPDHEDSIKDIAGYAACLWDINR